MKSKNSLKIKYDKKAMALYISVGQGRVARTEEWSKNYIVDYDKNDCIIGIEMLDVRAEAKGKNVISIKLPVEALA